VMTLKNCENSDLVHVLNVGENNILVVGRGCIFTNVTKLIIPRIMIFSNFVIKHDSVWFDLNFLS